MALGISISAAHGVLLKHTHQSRISDTYPVFSGAYKKRDVFTDIPFSAFSVF